MNIALLGPSGVGKGTHAASLAARFRMVHVATGDLFRRNLQNRTALGLQAQDYLNRAELVPDEVVDAMMAEWATRLPADRGALFDGFPRTSDQVHFLDELLQRLGRRLDAVVYLRVPDDEIMQRLSGRLVCRACQAPYHAQFNPPAQPGRCDECGGTLYARPDDTTALGQARLRIFHRVTEPVLVHYAADRKLVVVPGHGTVAAVEAALSDAFTAVENGRVRFAASDEVAGFTPPRLALPAGRASLDLVLLGGPGSGKGTQAERLSAALKVPHVATGDLFRDNLRQVTALGLLAKTYMDRGELVPDDVTDAMVEERIARVDARDGFILDGFPRTLGQAEALVEIMMRLHRRLAGVIYIKVSDAAIIERLAGRLICRRCQAPFHRRYNAPREEGKCDHCGGELYTRTDDAPETVGARLVTFHRQTEPLIAYYRSAGLLHEIAGEGDVGEISARCLATVQRVIKRPETFSLLETATP